MGELSGAGRQEAELALVATCALGLEELLRDELAALGHDRARTESGAVRFGGDWASVWRANWRLRTANRVLVELGEWHAEDGDQLAAGARSLVRGERSWAGLGARQLFDPKASLSLRAASRRSRQRDTRWIALKVKDGIVDGQREIYGKRSSVERRDPDLGLRLFLDGDRASLLLDTTGAPLDRRGYRDATTTAPLRENLAAACVLASGWDGRGPIVDPMCGSATLLIEAALWALGRSPAWLRREWSFQRLPGFDEEHFALIRREPIPAPAERLHLYGRDLSRSALSSAHRNLVRAELRDLANLARVDAFELEPPKGPGLLLVNPPAGERLSTEPDQWRRLGDLMKQRYTGWRAAIIANDADRGKHIGLRPSRRLPVRNGPLDARILTFDLY